MKADFCWWSGCGSRHERAKRAPLGSLGPPNSSRLHLRYYDVLYFLALQFGLHAEALLEVGCTAQPFMAHLGWIPRRTCVAPDEAHYDAPVSNATLAAGLTRIQADFAAWETHERWDIVICSGERHSSVCTI